MVFLKNGLFVIALFTWSINVDLAYADTVLEKQLIQSAWEKESGVKLLSIRTTAAGYMLDFRYKVINSIKASKFIHRKNKPFLTVLKNGSVLQVPVAAKIGPLRQSGVLAKEGKNYFMFFANPGKMVISGDTIKLTMGDSESKILVVE